MEDVRISPNPWLILAHLVAIIGGGYSLGYLYACLATFSTWGLGPILLVNSGVALTLLIRSPQLRFQLRYQHNRKIWGPGLTLFGLSLGAALVSRCVSGNVAAMGWPSAVAWLTVLWIPFVEELLFRGYFSTLLPNLPRWFWIYSSGLLFALAHTHPTVSPLFLPAPPLGPFLLGCLCAYLLQTTGTLWSAILLHAAGNATVIVFQNLDARWLDWLNWLYLKS